MKRLREVPGQSLRCTEPKYRDSISISTNKTVIVTKGRAEEVFQAWRTTQAPQAMAITCRAMEEKTHLADVKVIASLRYLGVVREEQRGVDGVLGIHKVTGVICNHDVGRRTVFTLITQADGLIYLEVGAVSIDLAGVDSRQLVTAKKA